MAVINRQQQGSGTEPVHDEEAAIGLQIPDPSRYIFLRTPKKHGEQLIPNYKDTPEAWVCNDLSTVAIHIWFFKQKSILGTSMRIPYTTFEYTVPNIDQSSLREIGSGRELTSNIGSLLRRGLPAPPLLPHYSLHLHHGHCCFCSILVYQIRVRRPPIKYCSIWGLKLDDWPYLSCVYGHFQMG